MVETSDGLGPANVPVTVPDWRWRARENTVRLLAAGLRGHRFDSEEPGVCGCGVPVSGGLLQGQDAYDAWCLHAASAQVPQA